MTEAPHVVLGVSIQAGPEEIRAAYLRKVAEHPPDRDPTMFEVVRDAYEALSDPKHKRELLFTSEDPSEPLLGLLKGQTARNFVGPELWMEALRQTKPGPNKQGEDPERP